LPVISIVYPEIDLSSSYLIQKAYIEKNLRYDKISGYKAALTSKESQNKFSADNPISGVLFESGKILSPSIIKSSDFRNMLIETELGFLVKNDITESIESEEDLKNLISDVYPVIELPDIGFKEISKINSIDIISINTGTSKYIVGKVAALGSLDINNIKINLFLDGRLISSGVSSEVMDNQARALLWLINDVISKGWIIKSGNILITGSVGKHNNSKPGLYMGDFSELGKLYFEIK
jgi:2-keto-4-pentenoate hydratase